MNESILQINLLQVDVEREAAEGLNSLKWFYLSSE
jgi:hypothetical protein